MKSFTESMRHEYPLRPYSIVLDCGGYQGTWAAEIWRRYGCNIHIFEPVKEFRDGIEKRFEGNYKITVHPFGVAALTRKATFYLRNDSTGEYGESTERSERVDLVGIEDILDLLELKMVELAKINCEGAEISLLEWMLLKNMVTRFINLQVQPHDVVPHSAERWKSISEQMGKTHDLTFCEPGVWYNWKLK